MWSLTRAVTVLLLCRLCCWIYRVDCRQFSHAQVSSESEREEGRKEVEEEGDHQLGRSRFVLSCP